MADLLIEIMFSPEGLIAGTAWVFTSSAVLIASMAASDALDRRRRAQMSRLNMSPAAGHSHNPGQEG